MLLFIFYALLIVIVRKVILKGPYSDVRTVVVREKKKKQPLLIL